MKKKPSVKRRPKPPIEKPKPLPAPVQRIMTAVDKLRAILQHLSENPRQKRIDRLFTIPKPWPGVVPDQAALAMDEDIAAMTRFGRRMAMDSASVPGLASWAGAYGYGAWDQAGFLGYSFLAELSQVVEFRRPSQILANEMTRKWGKIISTSKRASSANKIKELTADITKYNVQGIFNKALEIDNFFGIGHVYIDTGDTDNLEELKQELIIDKVKIGKGSFRQFKTVEPMWTYPNLYNANDPLKDDFYSPTSWYVMGKQIHKSRMLRFSSRPVPDMLKPSYLFGGISLTQLMKTYVDNWLRTRQSVSSIISNFSTMVLKTDMDQMTSPAAAAQLQLRAQVYNNFRDNNGLFICDQEKEDLVNVSAPISGLGDLQSQAIEQQSFPAGIPLVKLFGITPSGLNASSDGEVRVFYDSIASEQERTCTPHIMVMLHILQLNRYGEIDPDIGWEWAPLWELDEEKTATVRKTNAEIDLLYVEGNILDPQTILNKIVDDPESPYHGLSKDDLPEQDELGDEEDPLSEQKLMGNVSAGSIVGSEEKENKGDNRRPEPRRSTERRGIEGEGEQPDNDEPETRRSLPTPSPEEDRREGRTRDAPRP